ncbi:MAG TPA: hypothetical protein VF618_17460 [Thermoanaerobaculia bacterium]
MKYVKALLAIAILAAAVWYIRRSFYPPYRCNIVAMNVHRNTNILDKSLNPLQISFGARTNLELLRPCVEQVPQSVTLQMLAGANHTFLGQHEEARQRYLTAMQWDQRPELHHELGRTLLHLGREKEAYDHLVQACVVFPMWTDALPDQIRADMYARIQQIRGPEGWSLRRKRR